MGIPIFDAVNLYSSKSLTNGPGIQSIIMNIGNASDILLYAVLFREVLPYGLCVYKSHSDLRSDVSEERTASILSVAKMI